MHGFSKRPRIPIYELTEDEANREIEVLQNKQVELKKEIDLFGRIDRIVRRIDNRFARMHREDCLTAILDLNNNHHLQTHLKDKNVLLNWISEPILGWRRSPLEYIHDDDLPGEVAFKVHLLYDYLLKLNESSKAFIEMICPGLLDEVLPLLENILGCMSFEETTVEEKRRAEYFWTMHRVDMRKNL